MGEAPHDWVAVSVSPPVVYVLPTGMVWPIIAVILTIIVVICIWETI